MKMEKFTQGEWVSTEIGVCVRIESNDQSDGMLTPVARMEKYDFPSEHKANAALIAAAPEMYAMLNEISDGLLEAGGFGNCKLAKEIESLLEKARGEK
jgi:hypothetical protein